MQMTDKMTLPGSELAASKMPGHWLLARLGKRVLRPGGLSLTRRLLESLAIQPSDAVVEFAPGHGRDRADDVEFASGDSIHGYRGRRSRRRPRPPFPGRRSPAMSGGQRRARRLCPTSLPRSFMVKQC